MRHLQRRGATSCGGAPPVQMIVAFSLALAAPSAAAQVCATPATATLAAPTVEWLRGRAELLRSPARVATDRAGNSYVTDGSAGRVLVRDRFGRMVGIRLGLRAPSGIAVAYDGTVYVAEGGAGRVSVFAPGWVPAGALGRGDGEFQLPTDVVVEPASGTVFVSDGRANQIRSYGPDGSPRATFGTKGTLPGQLLFPSGLHLTGSGDLLVADQGNRRVQVFDPAGMLRRCFPVRATRIHGLASDANGRIYVSDAFQGRLEVYDPFGAPLGTVGRWGDGSAGLRTPTGVAVDPFRRLLVTSANGASVELFGLDAFLDPRVLEAHVVVAADALAAAPEGSLVVATIELGAGNAAEIFPATVSANGIPADPRFAIVGDSDLDGVPDLRVRFEASALRGTLTGDPAWLLVAGELRDGTPIEGAASLHLTSSGGSR